MGQLPAPRLSRGKISIGVPQFIPVLQGIVNRTAKTRILAISSRGETRYPLAVQLLEYDHYALFGDQTASRPLFLPNTDVSGGKPPLNAQDSTFCSSIDNTLYHEDDHLLLWLSRFSFIVHDSKIQRSSCIFCSSASIFWLSRLQFHVAPLHISDTNFFSSTAHTSKMAEVTDSKIVLPQDNEKSSSEGTQVNESNEEAQSMEIPRHTSLVNFVVGFLTSAYSDHPLTWCR